jgi:hypothetical protein
VIWIKRGRIDEKKTKVEKVDMDWKRVDSIE